MSAAARALEGRPPTGPVHRQGAAPARAEGARLWTEDGRTLLDFRSGDGAILLGHAAPEVEAAAAAPQASDAGAVEAHLAAMIPCAEAVRFARTAPAAMASALRMARSATGRERVVAADACAVPGALATFSMADMAALERLLDVFGDQVAAVVLDPMALCAARLAPLVAVVRRHGASVVFDESRTILRVHEGGAQALLGVVPDLAVVGPALGNGRSIAAVAGARALIEAAPAPVAPDAEALAAAAAVLRQVEEEPVVATLGIRGAEIQAETEGLIAAIGADDVLGVAGDPSWSRLTFAGPGAAAARALFLTEAAGAGLHTTGEHVMCFAHGDEAVTGLLTAYASILPAVADAARAEAAA